MEQNIRAQKNKNIYSSFYIVLSLKFNKKEKEERNSKEGRRRN